MIQNVSRENNFDFLRLFFAYLVIVSHAFPLSGVRNLEPLRILTDGEQDLGGVAVKCFFVISGYLIFQSLERSTSLSNYLWKRILRLFPGLFVMLVFTLFIVPIIYEGNVSLLKNQSYFTYLPRQLSLYYLQMEIEGVFTYLPYQAVNGSLWTICYEFTMYLMIGCLFFVKRDWRLPILLLLFLLFYCIPNFYHPEFLNNLIFRKIHLISNNVYTLGSYFTAGAILVYFKELISNKIGGGKMLLMFLLLCISMYFSIFQYIAPILLPIVIISFGSISTPVLSKIGYTIGDISYGVYIYGWLVQQLLVYFFEFNAYELIAPSLFISSLLGWISWHWVEKKALGVKGLIK